MEFRRKVTSGVKVGDTDDLKHAVDFVTADVRTWSLRGMEIG